VPWNIGLIGLLLAEPHFHKAPPQARPCQLHAAGSDVAVNLLSWTDKQDVMAGGIAFIPFHLDVRHGHARAARDIALPVRYYRNVVVAINLKILRSSSR